MSIRSSAGPSAAALSAQAFSRGDRRFVRNRSKVGPKFLKYMKARSIEEAGSLEAAVATIAARDYRKAISTLEEQIAKAEAGHANLS